jgi:hypothetical protein
MAIGEFRDAILAAGSEPGASTPEQMLALARRAATRIDRIVQATGIKGAD